MTRRLVHALAALVAVWLAAALPAAAHVTVRPDEVAKGATETLVFRVPNERDDAGTTQVVVQLPPGRDFATIEPQPVAGWTAAVGAEGAGTTVAWSGGPITGEARVELPLRLGPLPSDVDEVVFKALQTYDDGEVVRWIEEGGDRVADPEHPAPTLRLAGPVVTTSSAATRSGTGAVTVTTADDPVIGTSGDSGDDAAADGGSDDDGAGGALLPAVVVAAAVLGGGALVVARRRRA